MLGSSGVVMCRVPHVCVECEVRFILQFVAVRFRRPCVGDHWPTSCIGSRTVCLSTPRWQVHVPRRCGRMTQEITVGSLHDQVQGCCSNRGKIRYGLEVRRLLFHSDIVCGSASWSGKLWRMPSTVLAPRSVALDSAACIIS